MLMASLFMFFLIGSPFRSRTLGVPSRMRRARMLRNVSRTNR
jgi:hypothetical protein